MNLEGYKTSYIAGQLRPASNNDFIVCDKYSQAELGRVALASSTDIELACASALSGFLLLKRWSAEKRRNCLLKLASLLEKEAETFAQLICAEAGKPISYARAEISRCITTLEFAASESLRLGGEVVPMDYGAGKGKLAQTKRFPIGPVLGIVPFNFPLHLALHKLAPAIAAGCSVTLKASPYTPLSLLAFAALIEQTDLPPGAVNLIICDNEKAQALLESDVFKLFSFTGSPSVGWELKNKAGKKKVQLELGGNAAVIVDQSADLDIAAKAIAVGSFLYSGQICISTQRIYLHKEIATSLIEKLKIAIEQIPCGDPRDENVLVGPLIGPEHFERIEGWVKEALDNGAKLVYGGSHHDRGHNIFTPTLLENVSSGCQVFSEEVFGPVAIIETYDDFEELVEKVNESRFGLQAGLFSNDLAQMKIAFEKIEVGALIMNGIPGFRVDSMPYGGVKDSGLGREGLRYSIEEMTEPRLLVF